MSPYEIWNLVFSSSMLEHIAVQTNLYARRDQNDSNFYASVQDIQNLLGILLLSGYHTLPEEHHYWSTQPDLGVPIVYNTMSKNRYLEIKRYLHFANNHALIPGDKMSKVAPLYNMLNSNLVQFGVFHEVLSIYESMVPYFGRHSAKMFIKEKPIRWGYKIWSLCANDGYPYHLVIYQGKEENSVNLPLGTRVVNKMIGIVSSNSKVSRHCLYFDNFFTSYDLLRQLSDDGVRATGTIRETRTGGASKELPETKIMKKRERGEFDYRTDGKVYIAKWNDNAIVNIASNWETHEPISKASRRVKGGKKEIKQLRLVSSYNQGMGGVDLIDRLAESYRPMIRGKKWYWPLFINVLNTSVIAAWRLHCKVAEKKMTHLEFRRCITTCLLKTEKPHERPSSNTRGPVVEDVRFDGVNHFPGPTSQGRCKVCKTNTKVRCTKCDVRLHTERRKECFKNFHQR